jgi:hypothetical protein
MAPGDTALEACVDPGQGVDGIELLVAEEGEYSLAWPFQRPYSYSYEGGNFRLEAVEEGVARDRDSSAGEEELGYIVGLHCMQIGVIDEEQEVAVEVEEEEAAERFERLDMRDAVGTTEGRQAVGNRTSHANLMVIEISTSISNDQLGH